MMAYFGFFYPLSLNSSYYHQPAAKEAWVPLPKEKFAVPGKKDTSADEMEEEALLNAAIAEVGTYDPVCTRQTHAAYHML